MTVKQTQYLLLYLGYSPGEADGSWGERSAAACKAFQADYGLTADGVAGAATQKMLIGAVSGTAVKVENSQTDQTESWWSRYPNFTRAEFKCRCGGRYCDGYPAEPKEKLVALLQKIRDHYGKPLMGVSGLRCDRWNAIQGGVATSRHRLGQAMDFWISGESPEKIVRWVKENCPDCAYVYAVKKKDGTLAGTVHVDVVI